MKVTTSLRRITKPIGVLLFTSTLAACGGSSSSGGVHALATGTFSKKVALNGTSTGTHNSFFNDSTATMNTRQYLYRAEDINGAGNITSLSFQHHTNETADINCPDITITMAHIPSSITDLDPLQSNNTANTSSSTETVLDGQVAIPAGSADAYFEVGLDTTFEYNGSDNLLVEYTRGAACSAQASIREAQGVSYDSGAYGATALNDLFHTKFNFEGGDNRVVAQDQTGDNADSIAPGTTGRTQMLVRASDIDGEGPITGIRFDADTVTAESDVTFTVKMAHVDSSTTSLGSDFSTNYSGESPTIVADNLEVTIPADATKFWLPLTGIFKYNGNDNILVDVTMVSNNSFSVDYKDTADMRVVTATTSSATSGSTTGQSFQPTFRFNGADAIVANMANSVVNIFDVNGSGSYQSLYHSTSIGTAGKITKIACRLGGLSATGATDYPLKVVIGHASNSAMTTTFADNMVDAQVVFDGTYTLPAGKAGGDWAEITLETPFEYNGEDDLVITYRSEPGANDHNCTASNGAVYNNSGLYSLSASGLSGTPVNYVVSNKMEISR